MDTHINLTTRIQKWLFSNKLHSNCVRQRHTVQYITQFATTEKCENKLSFVNGFVQEVLQTSRQVGEGHRNGLLSSSFRPSHFSGFHSFEDNRIEVKFGGWTRCGILLASIVFGHAPLNFHHSMASDWSITNRFSDWAETGAWLNFSHDVLNSHRFLASDLLNSFRKSRDL